MPLFLGSLWLAAATLQPLIAPVPPAQPPPLGGRPCEVSLQGSPCSLAYQNAMADELGLARLRDDQIGGFKERGLLMPLPVDRTVRISPQLAGKNRWCLPAACAYLRELSGQFYAMFGQPLQINSAVRTVEYQEGLMRRNANAARGETPERRSPHLTGSTIDIAKSNLTENQRIWLRARLLLHEEQGRVEATEEFQQTVFHVMVFR